MPTATVKQSTDAAVSDVKSSKPLEVFRHRNLSASVFENQSKNGGSFLTVSLQRSYKDADDEYQHSSSFTRDEIPVARHLLAKAWDFILEQEVK
jgi:hypothetical protein